MYDSGKEEGKTFHKLYILGMDDDLWDPLYKVKLGKGDRKQERNANAEHMPAESKSRNWSANN